MKAEKPPGLIQELASIPVLAVIAATFAAAFYIFELRSGLLQMSDKVVSLEQELEVIAARNTEIAQLGWKIDSFHNELSRVTVKIDNLQQSSAKTESEIRDLQRDRK